MDNHSKAINRLSVQETLAKTTRYFQRKGIESPRINEELLLADVLSVRTVELYSCRGEFLRQDEITRMRDHIRQRSEGCPVQYILGETEFRELRVKVTPAVLIPRPETEILVGDVIEWIQSQTGKVRVLDIGTGSGNIALSICKEVENVQVVATDVSEAALEMALENAILNALEGCVDFRLGELFQPISPEETFHVVVSNPPYVPEDQLPSLQTEVRDFEPRVALTPGVGGMEIIEQLIVIGNDYLVNGGLLVFEIGDEQSEAVARFLDNDGRYRVHKIVKDYSGTERGYLVVKQGKWKTKNDT